MSSLAVKSGLKSTTCLLKQGSEATLGLSGRCNLCSNLSTAKSRPHRRLMKSVSKMWSRLPDRVFLIDSDAVQVVVNRMSPDLPNEKAALFEASPGPGFLTQALLEAGAHRVHAFERFDSEFIPSLRDIASKFPDRLNVRLVDIIDMKGIMKRDVDNGTSETAQVFVDVTPVSWSDPPPVKLFLPLPPGVETLFLRHLFVQLVHQSGLFAPGRTELLTFVSCYELWFMTANYQEKDFLRYRGSSVLFNTLFDIEYLDKVKWDCFVPPFTRKRSFRANTVNSYKFDLDNASLVRLTPRKSLADRLSPDLWPDYLFFISQCMIKRTNYVIPFLEKWVPDCGPKLIKSGFPLYIRFGDLSPGELFDLFCQFTTWPEYEESTFKVASSHDSNHYIDLDSTEGKNEHEEEPEDKYLKD